MTSEPLLLAYAGRPPVQRRSFLYLCWSACVWLLAALLWVVFVAIRVTLLVAGFALVFAGLVLLTLGGKRSAGQRLLAWRERAVDHLKLWRDDILRPIRRWRASRRERRVKVVPCLPLPGVTPSPR